MNNPLSDFDYNSFQLKTNDTHPEKTIDHLRDFIDSTQSNVSFQQKSSIFLNDERDNLKEFIEDMTLHYIYKRVFNDANMLYQEHKEKEIFIEKFIENLNDKYVINLIGLDDKLEEFSEEIYKLIQAPKKSDLKTWSKRLKNHAVENSTMNCYICGKETISNNKKNSIFLYEFLNYKDNPSFNNISKEIYYLFSRFKIKKSTFNKNKIINKIFEVFYKYNTFEYFKKSYKEAYNKFNNQTLEIEHNFPKSWGGAKNLGNLFVSCHKCNQDKKDISFYSEYSISRFFSNKTNMLEAEKSLRSKLGTEAILSLRMKQNYKCINIDCSNHFNSFDSFYIVKIDDKKGFYFSNLQIECLSCIKGKHKKNFELYGEKEFLQEYAIKI